MCGYLVFVKFAWKFSILQKWLFSSLSFCVFVMSFVRLFQRIRSTVDEKEQKQLLMDLDVVMRSSDCPYIVQFYGALFREVGTGHLGLS